jgi:hypothetical protein
MSRSTLWFIAAALFVVAAVASALGSQWIFAIAALVIAGAFVALGVRGNRQSGAS